MSTTYILVAGDARIDALLACAQGTEITALVAGPRAVADQVAAGAVSAVSWLGEQGDAPLEAYAPAVARIVADARPDLVLASTRPAERAFAGAVAAALKAPVFTMATSVRVADDVEVTRSVFGGIATETQVVDGPAVVVIDGGGLPSGGTAPVTEVSAAPLAGVTVTETRPAERAQIDLGKAQRIVSVGRGLKAEADIALVDTLAAALGAEVACSRPMAEGVGWFTHDRYVGVTGQHVSPDLYLALGISGQLQHTVGAREAATIVAVNTDKDAPYFAEADYCVVGDLYAVIPALTEALT